MQIYSLLLHTDFLMHWFYFTHFRWWSLDNRCNYISVKSIIIVPCREKTNSLHMQKRRHRSAVQFHTYYNPSSSLIQNLKLLTCFCGCTGRFVSDPDLFRNHNVLFLTQRVNYSYLYDPYHLWSMGTPCHYCVYS